MTLLEAAEMVRKRTVSSVELTTSALESIEREQPRLNAFLTVTGERALDTARQRDAELAAGPPRGPLHGIPVAVKDVFCTKGIRTTCGSDFFRDHIPSHDAAVVERLETAGAVLLGKTGLHEIAYGITSNNPHFGAVRNPWSPDHIPGGSSGGSGAAVAAGMAFMAMGSDTGGSIRIPASFCGTVGLKPTTGRISRYGVMPLDFTLDHMGPLTRTVRDAAVSLQALAGHDPRDDSSSREPVDDYSPGPEPSIQGLRLGIPENFFYERLQPSVERIVRQAASCATDQGAELIPIRLPDFTAINTVGRMILFAEASTVMEPYLSERSRFGADVLALLDQGRLLSATDYIQAQRLRRLQQEECAHLWKTVDCVLTPTTPMTAPFVGDTEVDIGGAPEDVRLAATRLVRGFNVLGLPALSLPGGLDEAGLPVGVQIIAPPFAERRVLRVGAAIEDALAFKGLSAIP